MKIRASTTAVPAVTIYSHLARLTDARGLFEHAQGDTPRPEHGYCVDDVARGLLVVVREPVPGAVPTLLGETYLRFLEEALTRDGRSHNRMSIEGRWTDRSGRGDWWGRSLWALGTAAATSWEQDRALRAIDCLAQQRSADVRASAFAAIGAAEAILAGFGSHAIQKLLIDAVAAIPQEPVAGWRWTEPRLRYANGSLAEAVIAAGAALCDRAMTRRGVGMLAALIEIETVSGRLSVTGSEGRGPADVGPRFDQQPIEVAAIADAAARAYDFTGDHEWLDTVEQAWAWFLGENDAGVQMIDLTTGAGFDGLEPHGRSDNRGAESTLAALSTWQQARRLGLIGRIEK